MVGTADVFDHRSADVDVEGNDVEPKSREEVDEDEEEEGQGGEELQAGPVCQLQSKPSSRNREILAQPWKPGITVEMSEVFCLLKHVLTPVSKSNTFYFDSLSPGKFEREGERKYNTSISPLTTGPLGYSSPRSLIGLTYLT